MGYLYRQYIKTIAKWPIDELKTHKRNLRNYLEVETEKVFRINATGQRSLINDEETALYQKRLKALQQLLDNQFLKSCPNDFYKTGHMGLTLAQLRRINSEEGRREIGIKTKKPPFWKKFFFK